MSDEAPAGQIRLGPVTVVFDPPEASELAQAIGHMLFSAPPPANLNDQQKATLHFLSQAALKLSAGLVQAMRDAGMSEALIARVTGNMQQTPIQTAPVAVEPVPGQMELGAGGDPTGAAAGSPDPNASAPPVNSGTDFVPQEPDFTGADPPNPVPDAPSRAVPQTPSKVGQDPPNPVPQGVPERPAAQRGDQ